MVKWLRDEIVRGNGNSLTELVEPESVALTCTSPPYRNAIDYGVHRKGGEEDYRGRPNWKGTKGYIQEMKKIFDQIHDVTIPGGYCCIVIGYEVVDTELVPLPSLLLNELLGDEKKRWRLREEIIWNKVTAGRNGAGNRFGVTAKSLKSETSKYLNYYPNIMHEYIFVLTKGDTKIRIEKKDAVDRIQKLGIHDLMTREIANSTWHIPPVPPRMVDHPCPFPEQIPWRLMHLYSRPNDVVLDPMNGSGQTTKVAKHLGRHYIGLDSEMQYVRLARRRLKEELHLSTLLVRKWEKVRLGEPVPAGIEDYI